jgi:hypothetical protein
MSVTVTAGRTRASDLGKTDNLQLFFLANLPVSCHMEKAGNRWKSYDVILENLDGNYVCWIEMARVQ